MYRKQIFVDYDLMSEKCKNCHEKNKADYKLLQDADFFILSGRERFFNDINRPFCINCFGDFLTTENNFENCYIWKVNCD